MNIYDVFDKDELIQIVKNIHDLIEKIEAIKLLSALTTEYQKDLLNTEIYIYINPLEDSHLINVDDL